MLSSSSNNSSSKLLKGSIISMKLMIGLPEVIVFQYNPETLSRSLETRPVDGGNSAEAFKLDKPPVETISLDIELDATDQVQSSNQTRSPFKKGIHPQLAALEMLLYPDSASVIRNHIRAATGSLEIKPAIEPISIFIWGHNRYLPVRITKFEVTEEAYDAKLNPIRAKVSLGMRVLTYEDVQINHPAYWMFHAHHLLKESMAGFALYKNLSGLDIKKPFVGG